MDKKITNKRVGLMDIVKIAEFMKDHCEMYKAREYEEQGKKQQAQARGDYYSVKYVHGSVKYTIEFNNNERLTKEDDIGWFTDTLLHNAKNISSTSLYFSASDDNSRESMMLTFTHNRIDYDTSTTNMYENQLAYRVEDYINRLPERFDELVVKDTRRTMLPALTISLPLGIIASFVLLILARMDIIAESVAKFLASGIGLTGVLLIIAFFGALLIPTENTGLYRNIKFETYYAGYNEKTYKSIHKNDYAEYKSRCEIAIGANANMPRVREKIQANYKKAKKVVLIELAIAVVSIALFFIL